MYSRPSPQKKIGDESDIFLRGGAPVHRLRKSGYMYFQDMTGRWWRNPWGITLYPRTIFPVNLFRKCTARSTSHSKNDQSCNISLQLQHVKQTDDEIRVNRHIAMLPYQILTTDLKKFTALGWES